MRVHGCVLAALAIAQVVLPDTASGDYDPFEISRDRFRATVHTIAIEPISIGPAEGANEGLAARIEARVRSLVEASGLRVVGSDVWEASWRAASEPLGGAWNAATGELDAGRARVVREATLRELAVEHSVDATMYVNTYLRDIEVYDSRELGGLSAGFHRLTWDGKPWMAPPFQWPQSVEATFLDVVIRDTSGVTLYGSGCSIRWVTIYAVSSFQQLDEAEFYPAEGVERAITACLDDLEHDTETARDRP